MRIRRLVFIFVLPLLLLGIVAGLFHELTAQSSSVHDTAVTTANDAALAKIDPALLTSDHNRAPATAVPVIIHLKGQVRWEGLVENVLVRPFTGPNGEQTAVAHVPMRNLIKLASQDAVLRVATAVSPIQPPEPPPFEDAPNVDWNERLALMRSQPFNTRSIPAERRAPDGWMDIGDVHHARDAWNAGYTGQGVKVLVNDSGIDFCHPDLIGTWAEVDDVGSPYDGWPQMFDSYSMYLYALDQHFGQTNIPDGLADYADTSITCALGSCVYQPIGAGSTHTYTLPATSQSGTYHIGSHPDKTLQNIYGERVAVLVADENTANDYDTVYVDLDNDYDFTDETPANKEMPIACLDNYDSVAAAAGADGYNDLSGGLVYFIADGTNPIPASAWLWGGLTPGNGNLVAFSMIDSAEPVGSHGQWVASSVAAQGVIDGENGNYPTWKPDGVGLVYGVSREAKLINNGNTHLTPFVEDAFLFAALGIDGVAGTVDDSQIINNSWGNTAVFNDGWDSESRLIDWLGMLNPALSLVFSTGNSGPGYGTDIGPSPAAALKVGASTLFGSTAHFDSITSTEQILWSDVIPFSSRGPGAQGVVGVDVTATGAVGTMAWPLNSVGDGWQAWGAWLGTSRSTPIASGVLALIYDAFQQANGRWPTAVEAREMLAAGAEDQHYDPFSQGAGMVNAFASAAIAAGDAGFYVSPSQLAFGDFRGETAPGFANVVRAGESATAVFTLTNPTASNLTLNATSSQLRRTETVSFTFTTADISEEDANSLDPASRHFPDYLIPISDVVPVTADLMEVNLIFPFDQFDPDGNINNSNEQRWLLQVINWTDVNNDGNLWEDNVSDPNGVVNQGEIDLYEYMRFGYDERRTTNLQVRVQQPFARMTDGLFLDLRHRTARTSVPTTTMQIELVFYEQADWPWLAVPSGSLQVPAGGQAVLPVTMNVPATAVPGAYSGFLQISGGGQQSQVPLVVNVAASLNEMEAPLVLGGQPAADTLYDNGRVRGHFDWGGDRTSGDWRFFFAEAENLSPAATMILSNTWQDTLPAQTDIDTFVYSPTPDGFSSEHPAFYGPYSLDYLASSELTYINNGKWAFQTSTSGPADMVMSPLADGLNLILEHNVLFGGDAFTVPFTQTVGTAVLDPAPIVIQACGDAGSVPLTLRTNVALPELQGVAFGLAQPQTVANQAIGQDEYANPSSASFSQTLTLTNTGRLEVNLRGQPGNDLDLYLLFDADENGDFDWNDEILAQSTGLFADEFIVVDLPEAGDYLMAVFGADVPNPPTTFDLTVLNVAGDEIELTAVPSNPIPVGETSLTLNWNKTAVLGETWQGVLYLGPTSAPTALKADVRLVGCGLYLPTIFK